VTARIVLASASPRRRELLARAGVEFEIDVPAVDEDVSASLSPEEAACTLAERKARAVLARHEGEPLVPARPLVVLAADTIVAVGSDADARLLGKPADAAEARSMLRALSGTRHRVVTGVCALSPGVSACTSFERTWVTMRTIEPHEIEAYVESGEWRDKAGGYAIQENADRFVVSLEEGGFDNVVGLPVALALSLIERAAGLATRLGGG
jgi:septum formation protein